MKVKEFISKTELLCEHCGKDLLTDPASGIFVTWTTKHKSYNLKEFYQKAYYCCKGACNEAMKIKSRNQGLIYNEQEDLSVYMNPLTYINKSMLWMDLLNKGVTLKPADNITSNVPPISLTNVPGVSLLNVPPVSHTNVPEK